MRIFFSTTFITLALLVGAAGAVPAAHAQQTPHDICSGRFPSTDGGTTYPSGYYNCLTSETGFGSVSADSPDPATANVKTDPKLKGAEEGFGTIMIWIMSLFAWLVGVAALLLDYTVYFTVVKMGSYVNDLSAIGVTWRVLRDIGNIMLIFGFLAAGIATILNTEFYGWKTKMLPMLLVAAVFINFSLFISEAIVDTGNLFATRIYTQINGGDPAGAKQLNTNFSFSSGLSSGEGISSKLMGQLGLQSIYGEVSNTEKAAEILKAGNSWVIGFMGVILFMVTAFVLFSLAFILIARFVALVFLLIVAPIGFAGLAIPGFAARAKQWWTTLLEQTITAPILLLMLYIALAVITDAQFLTGFCLPGESTITGAVNTNTTCTVNPIGWVSGNFQGFASFILSFLVAIALLLAVIVYAKRWSAFGGDWASRTGAKLSFGLTSFGLRSTAGWGLQGASQALRRTKFGSTKYGRAVNVALDKGAKGSFDLRGTGVLKTIPFGSSIDVGKAQEGGYRKRREDAIKGQQEYAKSIGAAFDERGISKKEEENIDELEAAQKIAETTFKNAKKKYDVAKEQLEPQIELQKAEVARLEAEKVRNDRFGVQGATAKETERKLGVAREQLRTIEGSLETTKRTHDSAAKEAGKAKRLAEEASKEAYGKVTEAKKDAQSRYATSISGSFPNWVMFGPGGAAAARKIKTEAKKSPDKQLLDTFKKVIANAEKESKPGEGKPEAENPKPATP